MVTSLTFYDGADCVGGNKILLEASGTSLFFDFGKNFSQEARYFDDFMPPRANAGLCDYLELDLLPPLEGIYRPDEEMSGRAWEHSVGHPARRRLHLDGILISHAHLDHTGYLSFLDPSVPIFTGATTAVIAKAMQDTGKGGAAAETSYCVARFEKDGVLTTPAHSAKNPCPASLRPFVLLEEEKPGVGDFLLTSGSTRPLEGTSPRYDPSAEAEVGGLRVRRWAVDHSIPGAGAFAVQTPEGWVVYSGDLRLHGSERDSTRAFFRQAAALHPLALICEATRVLDEEGKEVVATSEERVLERACELIRGERGLVVADFGPRNVVRLLSFLRAAQEANRRLVVTDKDAYLLRALHLTDPSVPDPLKDPRIAIYLKTRAGARPLWQSTLLDQCRASCVERLITSRTLREAPGDYVVCFSYWDLQELVDIQPKGGLYIYSSCEAFNEEMAFDHERLMNWVDHFGLRMAGSLGLKGELASEPGLHASGHIDTAGVMEMVETIRPQFLLPVHGERREFYRRFEDTCRVILPARGERVELG
jgi:ribonuclease J